MTDRLRFFLDQPVPAAVAEGLRRADPEALGYLGDLGHMRAFEPLPEEVPGRREVETASVIPDRLFRIETDEGEGVLVVEHLARYRSGTVPRMLRYAGRVIDHWHLPVGVLVIAFDGPAEPITELDGGLGRTLIRFRFDLVAVWKMQAGPYLQTCPLDVVPLMGVMEDLSPELLRGGLRRILEEAEDAARFRELVGDLVLLAHRRLPTDVIRRIVWKETGMSDLPMVDELLEEGRKEGREEGREEGRKEGRLVEARRSVQHLLERRFGKLPAGLIGRLEELDDLERLHELHLEAVDRPDLDAFLEQLEG